MAAGFGRIDAFPRVSLTRAPTPIDALPNLTRALGAPDIFVKRDDCTGLAMGGSKARLLEFYLGQAAVAGADTVLITGSVQSNYCAMTAAAARRCGLACHVQLEERVPDVDALYRSSGNVLLDRLFGATVHSYPVGEDEDGADRRLEEIADDLRAGGAAPYVIPLGPKHEPLGALGYVIAAREILDQIAALDIAVDEIVVASGSGQSHAGLLVGLRAAGSAVRVTGVCVRRPASEQGPRLLDMTAQLAGMLGIAPVVEPDDIRLVDAILAPGYGRRNEEVVEAMATMSRHEGLIVDPVYTGKTAAGLIRRVTENGVDGASGVLMIHTGGLPILFAYGDLIDPAGETLT